MTNYEVTAEFKRRVTDILSTKKFTNVFPWMNLINREDNVYSETELNSLVQFLGELPYSEVAEFFNLIPTLVKAQEATDSAAKDETQNDQCCASPEDCKECETEATESKN